MAGFSLGCEGFLLEQCLWIAESGIFCGFCAKGHLFVRIRLKGKTRFTDANVKKIITEKAQNSKVLHLLPIFKHP
jgi:aerobic-type carbon monoxide dehydrogenase small subunit (CoxS/CutS family)